MQTECPFRGEGQQPSCRGATIQSPFSLIASLPKREVHVGQAFFLNLRHSAPTEAPCAAPFPSSAGSNATESVAQQRKIDQDAQLLRGEFSRLMRATDERSAVLREAFAKINTAGNEEEVKDAFLALSDGTLALDERELDRFLRGKGDLTL